jgi:hypothetical protein
VRKPRGLFAILAIAALAMSAGPGGGDEKEKEKPPAKAKPPARSYSDEDLKKYKDTPKEGGADAQGGSAVDSGAAEETAPRQRRSREHGGTQVLPPPPPSPKGQEPAKVDSPPPDEPSSPEEADWRARAEQARTPVREAEGRIQGIEAQIAELRDRLNPMSTKYVLGGTSTAGPEAIYEIEEQLRTLETARGEAKTAAAEAEKSWQAFLNEARAAGASPAWLNP